MSLIKITAGYMPLVDAAPLIVAKEMGFAEEEGLALNLMPSPSWSTLRDMLAFGQIQAAHMLSPVPVASWLGLMNGLPKLQTLSVMSMNGNVIGVSPAIADALENAMDAPFACKAGVCSTCRAKVLEGETEMVANHALEDYEVRAGYVLTCQCVVLGDRLVLDYDQ